VPISPLILKRASASRLSGQWNEDDFDVLADGVVVGRIFKANASRHSGVADGRQSARLHHEVLVSGRISLASRIRSRRTRQAHAQADADMLSTVAFRSCTRLSCVQRGFRACTPVRELINV
jgi:hypothetical protein